MESDAGEGGVVVCFIRMIRHNCDRLQSAPLPLRIRPPCPMIFNQGMHNVWYFRGFGLIKIAIVAVKAKLLDYSRLAVCRLPTITTGATESEV